MSKSKKVGVLMLDTRFPRLVGDIGNPVGFDFPITYKLVRDASPKRVVIDQSKELIAPFVAAALELVQEQVEIITTSCGFLYMFQTELEEALPVPFLSSSLLLLPQLEAMYGENKVGVLTISGSSMGNDFRTKTGISNDLPIGTTEGGEEFSAAILGNRTRFDVEKCKKDNVMAAMNMIDLYPDIKAILLECTNMPPYAKTIEQATGLPVYSLNTMLADYAGN